MDQKFKTIELLQRLIKEIKERKIFCSLVNISQNKSTSIYEEKIIK